MKSDDMIHEIIAEFGSEDNRGLYKALKAFRTLIRMESTRHLRASINNAIKLNDLRYK